MLIKDGHVEDQRVVRKIVSALEHGDLNRVAAIVLHRTDSTTHESTLNAYKANKTDGKGAHFLVAKDGTIYQTARTNKVCWHAGILLPRCLVEASCDAAELKTINALLHEQGQSFSRRAQRVSAHETKKRYPLRYPSNTDSLGIEVVGKFWPALGRFETPTLQQLESVKWLVDSLVTHFMLSLQADVYAHGAIARKEQVEGAEILRYLLSRRLP